MKLQVIGNKGIVGSATLVLLERLGYEVVGSDKGEKRNSASMHFICVPEDFVEEVVMELVKVDEGLIVVRSTTPVGTVSRLMEKYHRHICHWPEHLREATSFWDSYFPDFLNIGECCREHGDWLASVLAPIGVDILRSDINTSEASKYAINCFKAMLISFWNEFYGLSHKLGFNAHLAARIATHDSVVPKYGTILGHAYGGKCLPKDIRALIRTGESIGYDAKLLKACEDVNNKMREEYGESTVKTG